MTSINVCDVMHRVRTIALATVLGVAATSTTLLHAQTPTQRAVTGAQIMHDLRAFRVNATVLHVGAHPDDENTQLIAYLARGRAYRTAYLSVTRGDGGQNLLSADLGEKLGVARTQELLAARRIDGGQQFLTRAIDYGFSKNFQEALGVWGHREILGDVVRVIRTFRPDVIITRFSPEPGGTHGHHTASAVLAIEAFRLAGDSTAYPEQLPSLGTWQPRRVFINGGTQGRGGENAAASSTLRLDISGTDPVRGESFAAVAAASRGMHKTQGFGQTPNGAPAGAPSAVFASSAGPRVESFQLIAGDGVTSDIMDGIDTTWSRIAGGADIGSMINDIIARFDTVHPAATVPSLLELRTRLASLPAIATVTEKRHLLDRIIVESLGLRVETVVTQSEFVPGERIAGRTTVTIREDFPVTWTGSRYSTGTGVEWTGSSLRPGSPATRDLSTMLPTGAPLTQPYWLREDAERGRFTVADPALVGTPENEPPLRIEHAFMIGGQRILVADEPIDVATRRRIAVTAPVSLAFMQETDVFSPGVERVVRLRVVAARAGSAGSTRIAVPDGWRVTPAMRPFSLRSIGDTVVLPFTVTPPAVAATAMITASADVAGTRYGNQRVAIDYPHIPVQLLQPASRMRASSFPLATRGTIVGYVTGAGDFIPEALRQMGYTIRMLDTAITSQQLHGVDAVVVGIRAMNVRNDLATAMPALLAYVREGGTVVMQYNQSSGLKVTNFSPFRLTLSQQRVTDENSVVTFLDPAHPVLNTPNRITAADFEGWVQERGSYFPGEWASEFTPILASADAGEAPLKGALLVADYGRGRFIYTGLSFFRQLPAGVPGAYRLFANLIAPR